VDAITIKPFVDSILEFFESMLGSTAQMGKPGLAAPPPTIPDIIGVIGLSGTAQGIVALRLPDQTAIAMIGRMVGSEFHEVDSSIIDGVGELVNIVAGSAKGKFQGHTISVSLPTVVRGDICRLTNDHDAVWIEVPFSSSLGAFSLIVTLKQTAHKPQEVAREGAHSR
jgi:chemotaxis protein CheX